MEAIWMWMVLLPLVLVAGALWAMRARCVEGIKKSSNWEPFYGTTRSVIKIIVTEKSLTSAEYCMKDLVAAGWNPVTWGFVGGTQGVIIVDPQDVKFLLKDAFASFEKSSHFADRLRPILGSGIFAVNGKEWKEQRIAAAHMFNRRQLRDRMSFIFGSLAQELVKVMQKAAEAAEDGRVDVLPLIYHFAFDSINGVAFNRPVSSMSGATEDCAFQDAFDLVQKHCVTRFFTPWWKVHRFFQTSESEREIKKSEAVIEDYLHKVVSMYYNEKGELTVQEGDTTMTGLYVAHAREQGLTPSRKYLKDMILNFLVAGRDTVSSALVSTIHFLCVHPEWQDRLEAEADDVFGGQPQEMLTFDDINDKAHVSYAVFMESLRLCPSVPANEKVTVADVTFPSGIKVPKGVVLSWIPLATNRHPKYWEDPEAFKPERWMDGKDKAIDDYMFSTFNAGPRLCLGRDMAILEGRIALLTLAANFRFTKDPNHTPKHITSVTLQFGNGLPVYISSCH